MLKISLLFKKKMQTIRVNNLRILSIKNAKFSGYYFYMNLNIQRNIQICISVPLTNLLKNFKLRSIKSFFQRQLTEDIEMYKL